MKDIYPRDAYYRLKISHKDKLFICDFNGFFVTNSVDGLDTILHEGIYFVSREMGGDKYQIDLYKDVILNDVDIDKLVLVDDEDIRERMLFNLEGDFG